jgi:histidine ammonia-lyase
VLPGPAAEKEVTWPTQRRSRGGHLHTLNSSGQGVEPWLALKESSTVRMGSSGAGGASRGPILPTVAFGCMGTHTQRHMNTPMALNGSALGIDDVVAVARGGRGVTIAASAVASMQQSRAVVDGALGDGLPHYGINTGFGSLSQTRISQADVRSLQRNLIRSHAAGVGTPLPVEVVRGMMLLLAASLCRGLSGARPIVAQSLVALLNARVTPVVPSIGSVGASGDLAPLAHVGLLLIGEGFATTPDGRVVKGAEALHAAGVPAVELEAKEGLAIINGTHLMASIGALLCHDASVLFDAALIAGAMSIDACRGTDSFLDDRVHVARCQPGQRAVAGKLRDALAGSEIIPSHREDDPRVQDPYSLRCMPQVLGAASDAMQYVRSRVELELGAVTDNPLVFADTGDIISAGNFHGMPLAIPLDMLAVALSHVAGIAERRVFWMLSAFDEESHLRPYLSPEPGLHSGLMIAQYTAAACCNELVGLSTPASVANIPTSAEIEDYNSFGPRAGAKAGRALELARAVVAIELLCAAEGLEAQRPLKSGGVVEQAHARIRAVVPKLTADRPPSPDIESIASRIYAGDIRFS